MSPFDRYHRRARGLARHLFLVLALAVGGWVVIFHLPIMPAQPHCYGGEGDSETVVGKLTREFHGAFIEALHIPFHSAGTSVRVAPWYWYDESDLWAASERATWAVIERRLGMTVAELREKRVRLPGIDHGGQPTCAAMAAIAVEGGAWAEEGPAPLQHDERWPAPAPGKPRLTWSILPAWMVWLLAWLGASAGIGAFGGYLVADWTGREKRERLMMGGFLGAVAAATTVGLILVYALLHLIL